MSLDEAEVSPELIAWVDKHAGLEKLCERGGWPDGETLRIDVCRRSGNEMIADISTRK